MTFSLIQFSEEDGGTIAVVHSSWLTPRKTEVHWPPYKKQLNFDKALLKGETVDTTNWSLYKIKRIFNNYDDLKVAKSKARIAEETSDLQTDPEEGPRKRRIIRPAKYISSDSDEDLNNKSDFPRPPKIAKPCRLFQESHQEFSYSGSPSCSFSDNHVLGIQRSQGHESPTTSSKESLLKNTPYQAPSPMSIASNGRPNFLGNESVNATPTSNHHDGSVCDESFRKKILQLLITVKLQNEQILNRLNERDSNTVQSLPPTLPIEIPLKTLDDVKTLENYLKEKNNLNSLSCYLASLGGNGSSSRISRILRTVMTDDLASRYNFIGSRQNKLAFSTLALCRCIIRSVKLVEPDSSDRGCEDLIKNWLKHAPQRTMIKRRRTE